MVRHRTLAFSASCLSSLLSAQEPERAFDFAAAWRGVEAALRAQCEQHHVVGGSLMFVRGASEAGFAAFGDADRSSGRAVDRDTIFHWASCTKTLTAIAVMQLRDRGKLRLDQPIVDFVPELRQAHDPFGKIDAITIRHLLTHSAGFRGGTWPWGGDKPWHPHEPTQWSQLVAMMPYTEVEFAPGSRFSYSNPGIVFLGRAIEQLSGDDYEVYMDKNVLRPLAMQRSYFDVTPYHLQRYRSHSYAVNKDGSVEDDGPDFDTGITVSNGGLNAPLPDMARYLAFLLGAMPAGSDAAAVLAHASLEEMWQPGLPVGRDGGERIGLGFFVHDEGGQRFLTHTGGQRDFVTFFYVHPASGTGALGAFNTSTAGPVMSAMRARCMKELSIPMTKASKGEDSAMWNGYRLRIDARGDAPALDVTVPTGGFELVCNNVTADGDAAVVDLTLTTPGDGEMVVQALADLSVPLPHAALRKAATARIRISTWRRGEHYFVAPPHELAATLRLR